MRFLTKERKKAKRKLSRILRVKVTFSSQHFFECDVANTRADEPSLSLRHLSGPSSMTPCISTYFTRLLYYLETNFSA